MSLIIRELNELDYKNFYELINDFRDTEFTEDEFKDTLHKINRTSKIYVIELNSKLIATGTLILEQKFIFNRCILGHIEDVCVKKEYRANGYGKLIVSKLIEEAKHYKCYKITLDCSESNTFFYSKNGFEARGVQMSQLLPQ